MTQCSDDRETAAAYSAASIDDLRSVAERLAGEPVLAMLLTGSRARGECADDSDYDVIVLCEGRVGRQYVKVRDTDVDFTFRTPQQYEYLLHTARSASDVDMLAAAMVLDDSSGQGARLVAQARAILDAGRGSPAPEAMFTFRHRVWSLLNDVRRAQNAGRAAEARLCAAIGVSVLLEAHVTIGQIWVSGPKPVIRHVRTHDERIWKLMGAVVDADDATVLERLEQFADDVLARVGGPARYGGTMIAGYVGDAA